MALKRIEGLLPHPLEWFQIGLIAFIETFSENEFGVSLMRMSAATAGAEAVYCLYLLVLRQGDQAELCFLEIEQLPFGLTLFILTPTPYAEHHLQAYQTFTQALLLYVKAIGCTLFHSKPDPDQGLGLSAEEPSHEK